MDLTEYLENRLDMLRAMRAVFDHEEQSRLGAIDELEQLQELLKRGDIKE